MKTVYVGLSGGVDSSVTAALLQDEGYRVVGVYMKNWTRPVGGVDCPWKQDLTDARSVAAALGIPFKVFDFEQAYRASVVEYMVAEYTAGRTPNPDVMCNQEIKFKLFLETALADGADLIATGHYARVRDGQLLAGVDQAKDQSYFLYRINAPALNRALMPIGELTKPEVRRLAAAKGLPTAAKKDSQGICFVGQVGIKDFLREYTPVGAAITGGPVVRASDKTVLGQHDGAIYYTIGQRHGLGIGGGKPFYVTGKDMATNTVWVTDDPEDLTLSSDSFIIRDCHWLADAPDADRSYQVRSRYRAPLVSARLSRVDGGYQVQLERPERAISVGQSAVVYDNDVVMGGGIIATNS